MQKTKLANYEATHFLWEATDGVALITLNRPDRKNPLTFESYAELRDLFRALVKINGIGTKVALAILSNLNHGQLLSCVQSQEASTLTQVPGIGKKTAARLLIDLRDALKPWLENAPQLPNQSSASQEAISALVNLGYKTEHAERTVMRLSEQYTACEDLIRHALKEGIGA